MPCEINGRHVERVALLAEGVDRNDVVPYEVDLREVALLAEGVDRNRCSGWTAHRTGVALLAEGVDRNVTQTNAKGAGWRRPPRGGRG